MVEVVVVVAAAAGVVVVVVLGLELHQRGFVASVVLLVVSVLFA